MKKYIFEINIAEKSVICNGLEISWEEAGITDQQTQEEIIEVIEENNKNDLVCTCIFK